MISKAQITCHDPIVDIVFQNVLKNKNLPVNLGLASGRSGLMLLYIHLYKIFGEERLLEIIEQNISTDLAELGSVTALISYYRADLSIGITGFAYTLNYLFEQNLLVDGYSSIVNEIDDAIYNDCFTLIGAGKLNYLHGISGPLHHLISQKNIDYEKVSGLLKSLDSGISVLRLASYFTNELNQVNYSAPFGITGFLLILLKIRRVFVNNAFVDKCLHQGGILIYRQLTKDIKAGTDINVAENVSWCNGMLMASVFLYKYGIETNDTNYSQLALKYILLITRKINVNLFLIKKLTLGQGLAGLVEIFKENARLTHNDDVKGVLDMLCNKFLVSMTSENWKFNRENSSLFNGLAGKGLVVCGLQEDSNICKNILLL